MSIKTAAVFVFFVFVFCFLLFFANALRIALRAMFRRPIARYIRELEARESYCPLDDVSKTFQWTVARMEDPRYGSHHGIDLLFTARAIKKNLRAHARRKNMFGGSTITQQLAKNLYLSPEKTFTRKLAELFIALYLEAKLDKAKILELYINVIYYGHGQYGIRQAALFYYHVNPAELSLNQSVTLACILPCPDAYNPIDNPELFLKARSLAVFRIVPRGLLPIETAQEIINSDWRDPKKELKIPDIECNMPF